MGLLLLCAFLVSIAFNIATGKTVKPNPYRFPVYPVNECPRSKNEFKTAAQRRNCTRGLRYLCAPNKYMSSLIEFCTDRPRSLYEKGNCVLLEGTGDLDHYSCVEKFNSSCPSEYYYDEDIFKYPACLEIDKQLRCFAADNDCNKRDLPTTETHLNISRMETVGKETFRRESPKVLAIVYIITVVSVGFILIWIIFKKRRKGSPVSHSDDGSGTLNAQMEGREDGEAYVKTSVQETNILQSNSDLVGDIGFVHKSKQHNVIHTESNRQTVIEAQDINMLNTTSDNDTIGVPDTKGDSETDHIHNIDEHASQALAVVVRSPMNRGTPVPYSDDGSGTLNAQMEGPEDGETYVKTSVQETNILQSNSDLVGDIGFLHKSDQHNVTHTESNRQTVIETQTINMLNTTSDNGTIGVPDAEGDNGTDHINKIDDHASPAIAVVVSSPMNRDTAEQVGPWTEEIEVEDLHNLFGCFHIKLPEDPEKISFTREILGESRFANFIEEIRNLARSVVLYKYLSDEAKTPGTIYVSEVSAKYKDTQIVIEEKDARQTLEFFQVNNQNLVKVIMIKGDLLSVLETKKKVYQKYKELYDIQSFYLHHESEQYTEVAKLSAHQKVVSYKQFVESVRDSIPLENIEEIVKVVVNRALSKESITELCFDTVIQESGNTNSDPYYCQLNSTLKRLKKELANATVHSVRKHLVSEICAKIQRHIKTEIQSKQNIDPALIQPFSNLSSLIRLGRLAAVIASIFNRRLGIIVALITIVGSLLVPVDVNSRSWRRDVANEIYKQIDENKKNLLRELTSDIRKSCIITVNHLNIIVGLLEDFRSRIHFSDEFPRLWEES